MAWKKHEPSPSTQRRCKCAGRLSRSAAASGVLARLRFAPPTNSWTAESAGFAGNFVRRTVSRPVGRVLRGAVCLLQPFTAHTCAKRQLSMCRSGISGRFVSHYAMQPKGRGSCLCLSLWPFSWRVPLYAVCRPLAGSLFWMGLFCWLCGLRLLSRLGAKHEQGRDLHATMRKLMECVIH